MTTIQKVSKYVKELQACHRNRNNNPDADNPDGIVELLRNSLIFQYFYYLNMNIVFNVSAENVPSERQSQKQRKSNNKNNNNKNKSKKNKSNQKNKA